MMEREDQLAQVAAFALGVLPEREAREVRERIAGDAELRREYLELRDVADAVGYAAEVPAGALDAFTAARLKSRVMRSIRSDAGGTSATATPRRGVPPWLGYALAAAAFLLAIASYANAVSLRLQVAADRVRIDRDRTAAVAAHRREDERLASAQRARHDVETLLGAGARHYPVQRGEVVATQGRLYLALRSLKTLPAGRVYQAWTIPAGGKPVPSATFVPQGEFTVVALGAQAPHVAAVALSVEPAGGSKQPTTKPAFIRKLS